MVQPTISGRAVTAAALVVFCTSTAAALAGTGEGTIGPVSTRIGTESGCITCHRVLEGPEATEGIVHDFGFSAHASAGLDCSDCHGGNPDAPADVESFDYTAAKGPGTGFRGVPAQGEIPAFCGRCHSDPVYMRRFAPGQRVDQERLYWTSRHGEQLRRGNAKVATCVDCHLSHRIMVASDPRSSVAPGRVPDTCARCHSDSAIMEGSTLSTSIAEEYRGGVHGKALLEQNDIGAPACNDCHGNHGAVPPGVTSVSAVCSQCHVSNAGDFQASPHGPIFEALREPACEACHGNHAIDPTSDQMLSEDGTCAGCHSPGDPGWETAARMLDDFTNLVKAIAAADSLLEVAHRKGMEVGDGLFTLQQARNGLVRGRAAMHTFSVDSVHAVTDPGLQLAWDAQEIGLAAIAEFKARRTGWEVFLLFSILLVAGLALLLRRMERPGGRYPLRKTDSESPGQEQ